MDTRLTEVWDSAEQANQLVLKKLDDELTQEQIDAMELAEAKRQLEAVKAQLNLKTKSNKKRGKAAAYDAGSDAILVTAKLPAAWIAELLVKINSSNKSLGIYTAVKTFLNK